jgi:hypothetical protein
MRRSIKVRRPYRFITFAILLSTFTVFMSNAIYDVGVLLHTNQGKFIGWVAGAATLLMVIGLASNKRLDRALHYGLLLAGFTWITRTAFIGISEGLDMYSFWLSMAWVIVIVGTYILEAYEPEPDPGPDDRHVSDGVST